MTAETRTLTVTEAWELAIQLHRAARLPEAETLYQEIIRLAPAQPDAWHFLGVLRYQQGRAEEAVELIHEALALNPNHPDAHNNLGNVLKSLGRLDEAEDAYRQTLALNPDHADAHNNMGLVLKAKGRGEQALSSFGSAIEINPQHADAHYNLGNLLADIGRQPDAIAAYRRTIAICPGHFEALKALGVELYRAGRPDEATAVYRQLLDVDPDNPVAQHMLAACSGEDIPLRASDAYVRRVFDGMASSFDTHLAQLDYRAPKLIEEAVAQVETQTEGRLQVLDAGCGTGLCGRFLRPYSHRLVGIDLSGGMLARAEQTGAYGELVKEELTAYMQSQGNTFDLIVSADTLVYFGALKKVLSAAARALCSEGHLVFTLEHALADEAPQGFRLNAHGRYSHTRAYVETLLAEAGLTVVRIAEVTLRSERGIPVKGLLVVSQAPSSSTIST